jgi:hypothetical protein
MKIKVNSLHVSSRGKTKVDIFKYTDRILFFTTLALKGNYLTRAYPTEILPDLNCH